MIDLEGLGIVAIVRHNSDADLVGAARALLAGGLKAMEVTLTTPGALDSIRKTRRECPEIRIGAGTILSAKDAEVAIEAGAEFIVTPTVQLDSIATCRSAGIPILCGCMTPTEALAVHSAGADYLKLFPAESLGPGYVKALLAPMPFLKIVPTGGVTLETLGTFFEAGCKAVAVGSNLVSRRILDTQDWGELEKVSLQFSTALAKCRR